MKRLVDYIIPDNCRQRLQRAAAANTAEMADAICLLEEHRNKILPRITFPVTLKPTLKTVR